jgi:UDP-GlcNAc:undecaprenyl-phosphate GlcNAc-1-phosphate transferase
MFVLPALVAGILSYLVTPCASALARRVGAIDEPGPRKVHQTPVPRLGGLAVLGAIALVLGVMSLVSIPGMQALPKEICAGLGLGILPILAVSLWDDIKPLRALPKFAAQFAGAGVAVAFGIRLGTEVHLFGQTIHVGYLAVPISLLWIVGVSNAFNLVDGIDGLSAGLALISSASLGVMALVTEHYGLASVSFVLTGALIGFLPHNTYPAKIFLGDVGATSIGFSLACLALGSGSTLSSGMAVLVPVVVLGVPVAETLVSMLRRLLRRVERLGQEVGVFQADSGHFHHRLLAMGLDQRRAVIILYGIGIVLAGIGVLSMFLTYRHAAVLLATLIGAAFIGLGRLGYDEFALIRGGIVLRFYEAPVLKRALFPVFFDLGLVALAIYGAIVLKYDDWSVRAQRPLALQLLALLPSVTFVVFWGFRLYRGAWRHASVEDLMRSSAAVGASSLVGFALFQFVPRADAGLTFFLLYGMLLLFLVNGSRASFRVLSRWKQRTNPRGEPVVIYGAGEMGTMALREILSNGALAVHPVGFLDDDKSLAGRFVNGYPVFGSLELLDDVVEKKKVKGLLVASAKIPRDSIGRARRICDRTGIWMMRFNVDLERDPGTGAEAVGPSIPGLTRPIASSSTFQGNP